MRFACYIKAAFHSELLNSASHLGRLLDKTGESLPQKYPNYYGQGRLWGYFMSSTQFRYADVPAKEIKTLQGVFAKYIERLERIKRHTHRWSPVGRDSAWLWTVCGDRECDASAQFSLQYPRWIFRLVALPFAHTVQKGDHTYLDEEIGRLVAFFRQED
jgi:hypothetical protein